MTRTRTPAPLVMDMLHNLFDCYDLLCEKHGVFKVETVGDGCVMAAGLIDDEQVGGVHESDKGHARKAIAIAEDMIVEARNVRPPLNRHGERPPFIEIRVEIGKHAAGVCYDGAGARGWGDEGAGGAGGGSGGHVQRAGRGKHAVGVCDDGAGARGWGDARSGGAG